MIKSNDSLVSKLESDIEEDYRSEYIDPTLTTIGNGERPFTTISEDAIPYETLPGTDIRLRICCYQTARLSEAYCKCGRAIDKDIINRIMEKE